MSIFALEFEKKRATQTTKTEERLLFCGDLTQINQPKCSNLTCCNAIDSLWRAWKYYSNILYHAIQSDNSKDNISTRLCINQTAFVRRVNCH